jgi:hypothetical protein
MHDAGSVRFDGWRHLLQRRLVASRHEPSVEHAATATGTRADQFRCLQHTRPVRGDGRGHLLQRWLAATGGFAPLERAGVNAATATATAVDTAADDFRWLRGSQSVRSYGWRHLL